MASWHVMSSASGSRVIRLGHRVSGRQSLRGQRGMRTTMRGVCGVAVKHETVDGDWHFLLQPNITVEWRQSLLAYGLIATISLGTALVFSWRGYWPVLPYVLGTLWMLGWALYRSAQRVDEWEVIVLRVDCIEIRKGRRNSEQRWLLPSYWTEVNLQPSGHRWYPSHLSLRSGGVAVEIGRFLHEEERAVLAQQLKRKVGFMAGTGEHS